ncbi:bifunctional diaminohydroxyphosphoribosylaminopyrimidine deaminase/5-amino-6-(5-phosphoribosylamino)uracil reductase RibD [Ilumatobacter sp.]|uniref:bifunctional diaminohydroxyphosphoribosylaminopyrimidine deaminase/5-amino-6-(5-phosphoribosylamino)uracil reductase RibD n=1 Tax=Ilumatobacter sp. TaxID=1967498 RepID=UPI003B520C8C
MDDDATAVDDELMTLALEAGEAVRTSSAPNPWVGAALLTADGRRVVGATEPPGGAHAEVVVLRRAGAGGLDARGATLATTLEPCSHDGRTGPCTTAIVEAGVARVVVGVQDPDAHVDGSGIDALRAAGVEVTVGTAADRCTEQLAAYLHHRRTGRPYVIVKTAATLDGRTADPDKRSRWITSEEARADTHVLRAQSQAILVGSGTVRADDPELTVRLVEGPDPRRIVLGSAPRDAKVRPCLEWRGELPELLDSLGADGVLQLMVEGGASTAAQFQAEGLVDRFVVYLAPALFGGDDARPMFVGLGATSMEELPRGRFADIRRIGPDVRIDLVLD